jgi:hypothetical protein
MRRAESVTRTLADIKRTDALDFPKPAEQATTSAESSADSDNRRSLSAVESTRDSRRSLTLPAKKAGKKISGPYDDKMLKDLLLKKKPLALVLSAKGLVKWAQSIRPGDDNMAEAILFAKNRLVKIKQPYDGEMRPRKASLMLAASLACAFERIQADLDGINRRLLRLELTQQSKETRLDDDGKVGDCR